jgi:hypothetical protein
MRAVGSADDPPAYLRPIFCRLCGRCPGGLFLVCARRFVIVWRRIERSQIRIILNMY